MGNDTTPGTTLGLSATMPTTIGAAGAPTLTGGSTGPTTIGGAAGTPTTTIGGLSPHTTMFDAPAASRPGVVQLAIKERPALYASYMPFLDGGGLFVPTTRPANIGDELYLILQLLDDPNKMPVTGKVVWITPPDTPGRQQGIGVQFAKDQGGEQARLRIESLLGGALRTNRPTHTI